MKFLIFIFIVIIIFTCFALKSKIVSKYIFNEKIKNTDILIICILIISSCIIIFSLITVDHFLDNPVSDENGKIEYLGTIGDLIGGLLNPAIAVPATLLTFLAFWVQYKANEEVRKQFDIQRFESELNLKITILRQEITEMKLPALSERNYEGREVMYQLDKELKFIYFIVKNSLQSNDYQKILAISYYIFFKGRLLYYKNINQLSIKFNLQKKELINIEIILSDLYEFFKYKNKNGLSIINDIEETNPDIISNEVSILNKLLKEGSKIIDYIDNYGYVETIYETFSDLFNLNLNHVVFKGHETRLSILFRQIFTITKFVNQEETLTYEQKRSYLRTLRSLLTNYDQMHIFYNWYSKTADKWENKDNKFLTDMRMIHNIPLDLLIEDFELINIFSNRNFNFEKGRKDLDSLFEHLEIYSNRHTN